MEKLPNSVAAQNDGHLTDTSEFCRPKIDGLQDYNDERNFLTVHEVAKKYKISTKTIYKHIKNDPTFPYVNIGIKKRYMIDEEFLRSWIFKRTYKEQHELFSIPSADSIIRRKNDLT